MNQEWSLDTLYKGYEDPEFIRDMERLPEEIQTYRDTVASLKQGEAKEKLKEFLLAEERLEEFVSRLGLFIGLKQSVNTADEKAADYQSCLSMQLSAVSKDSAIARKWVASIENLEELIRSDELFSEYAYLLRHTKEMAAHVLSDDVEDVIARLNVSAGQAWGNLQSYLTSSVEVDYDGGVTNLPAIRNLAYSGDPQVRKAAYEAELAAYPKIADSVAFALNNIKSQVNTVAELRGYASPLDMTLKQARMSRDTLEAMLASMRRYLPKFHEYLRMKARLLGYENGLPWFELFAPMGGDDRRFTTEEAKAYLLEHFTPFAQDLADMIGEAFDNEWIDFFPRKGKEGGAFCAGSPRNGRSWILTNFDGALGDVVTLAHELGHAYHNRNLEGNRILNTDYSMPVAETASTFNEVVIMSAAIAEAEGDARMGLLESQLQDTTQIICDIYSRYLFETAVFEARKSSFLFAPALKEAMLNAQKEAYGDGLDPEYLHPYMWVCKSHYYSSGLSFYNFPYAFGGLFARGLYARYLEEGEAFLPAYRKLLRATAVSDVEDVAGIAGIDLTQPEFWDKSLAMVAKDIDTFLALGEAKLAARADCGCRAGKES